jgi:SAM-dependent methyltransferase
MSECLGRPLEDLKILEIGPGQQMEKARYFGARNDVTVIDLDVIPRGFDLAGYMHMLKKNGWGRLLKTIGRKSLLVDRANRLAWERSLCVRNLPNPRVLHGDISRDVPGDAEFDLIVSWSVFEHIPDPRNAVVNVVRALRPGGVFYLSIHLYTSNTGHHDIRASTGMRHRLPAWGHLRETTRHQLRPCAYLNEWRLSQWRNLFVELTPDFAEFLDPPHDLDRLRQQMTAEISKELEDYGDEELYTLLANYSWKKPENSRQTPPKLV